VPRRNTGGRKPCALLHIVPNYGLGGVELAAESAAVDNGGLVRVHFLAAMAGQPLPKPCPWVTIGPQGSALGLRALVAAIRQIREADPEILLFSLWRPLPLFLAAKLLFPRKKFVLFLHLEKDLHWVDAIVTRIMLAGIDEVWADSEAALKRRGKAGRRGRVISMVIHPPSRRRGKGTGPRPAATFISWCRLNRQKRVDRALELVAKLKQRVPGIRYTALGPDGGELASLRVQVESLGLQDNVAFAGPKNRGEIERAAASASFFLQLSDFEGQSMAVMEAMQLGLVPVVTPVGGIPTYSEDGADAVYVGDLDVAASRLGDLMSDPRAIARMSAAAKARFGSVRTYSEDIRDAATALASE
jgi:glycosyltransferase involved in cell wall biosynthesis